MAFKNVKYQLLKMARSRCFRFNKIIKGPGTSFQSPALSQNHVRKVCHLAHKYLTKFYFCSTEYSKEISINVTSIM